MNDCGNSLGGMSREKSMKEDQTESETDNWKDFVSEHDDDMNYEHVDGKVHQDEAMVRASDESESTEDPRSEETKAVKMKRTPKQPSQREREEHEKTHLPFRDWCTHCIKAKSRNDPHKREADVMKDEEFRDDAISTVSFDYSYFNDKLGKMSKEEYNEALRKGDKMNRPMVVVEDRETGTIVAHMCSQKGPGDKWIVGRIGKDIEEMGYGGARIILKCDQESPITAVQQEVIKNRKGRCHGTQTQSSWRITVERTC